MQFHYRPTLFVSLSAILLSLSLIGPTAYGQEDLEESLGRITEAKVKQIVTYLASDKMAGRDTPSPELQQACEYVRDHFKSLGLKGAGEKGSFFHTTTIPTVAYPSDELEFLSAAGQPIDNFGLFSAGDEEISITQIPEVVDPEALADSYDGLVFVDFSASEEKDMRRRVRAQNALLRRLQTKGATAIIAQVKPDDVLVGQAKRMGRPRMSNTRRRISVPTLLVKHFDPTQPVKLKIPGPQFKDTQVHNVMAQLPGTDAKLKEEAIIISAHLDHVGVRSGAGDTVYNGADDNATGVTAVMMLAEAYAKRDPQPKRTVIFMTFWGEEKGLLGSRKFVERPTWPLEKIVANINIEMVGRPEGGANGKAWMTGWEHSDLGTLMAVGAKKVGVEIFNHPKFSAMLYRASDNASFNAKGVIAHSFSAGSLHSDYHQVTDEVEKLDIPHMTKVIRGLFAGSLPLANGDVTPAKE